MKTGIALEGDSIDYLQSPTFDAVRYDPRFRALQRRSPVNEASRGNPCAGLGYEPMSVLTEIKRRRSSASPQPTW
jgi:hypothetical protein